MFLSRASVIQCLADLMLRDVLKRQNGIIEDCRDELKLELLQRVCFNSLIRIFILKKNKFIQSESIDFDPALAKACTNDIRQYCGDRTPGNAEVRKKKAQNFILYYSIF